MDNGRGAATSITLLAALLSLTGCRIGMERNDLGEYGNVKVATPFGGVQVKTNDISVVQGLGLPVYLNAKFLKNQDNNGAADVDLSLGGLRPRIKTASFESSDSPDKVSAFYLKALDHYGEVIECHNGRPVGSLAQTSEGLTCDMDRGDYFTIDGSHKVQLKAGSWQHQHIVVIDPKGSGSRMELVAIDLPGHTSSSQRNSDNSTGQ